MSILLQIKAVLKTGATLVCMALLLFLTGCKKGHENPELKITTLASGLENPMGLGTDRQGNIWVTTTGTGVDDAKVIVIKPNGEKYDAIINLSSFINKLSGELHGAAHLLLDKGILYVLSGNYLYKANVTNFKPGDTPLDAATIPFEDIGAFVLSYDFINDAEDTHPYNLTKGPGGDLFIADAGANAILHRTSPGVYSVLAEIPGYTNPTPVGPPVVQSVPTSLLYDGHQFLVTTLTGFPFLDGQATVFKVSKSGAVSVHQQGFTTLMDIAEGGYSGRLVMQHSQFGPTGFIPNTGALIWANGSSTQLLTGTLNMPVALKQLNPHTWYLTSLGDGTVLKVSYQ